MIVAAQETRRTGRIDGTAWQRAPEGPTGPWIMPLWISRPGRSGLCNTFGIPADMPPGRYRVTKRLSSPPTSVAAEFNLVP